MRLPKLRLSHLARASLIEFLGMVLLVLGLFAVWAPLGILGAGALAILVSQGVSDGAT